VLRERIAPLHSEIDSSLRDRVAQITHSEQPGKGGIFDRVPTALLGGARGFYQYVDSQGHIGLPPFEDGQRPLLMSVKAFVGGDAPAGRLTPLDVADQLMRDADEGLAKIGGVTPGQDAALTATINDIRAMAWLGRYYAEKTRGAVALARYQRTGARPDHTAATEHLTAASRAWHEYAAIWSAAYLPQHLTRMGPRLVDIAAIQADVDKDIPAPLTGQ